MRKKLLASAALSAALALFPAYARAQSPTTGIALDRFNPSERGSEWFALDTLDLRGTIRPAVGVVAEYANLPFVAYNPNGTVAANVVAGQAFLHAGASMNLLDSLRIAFNVPVVLANTGTSGDGFTSPNLYGVGDIRVSADLRLLGEFGGPGQLALGGQVFLPSGESKRFTGDSATRGIVHLAFAGEVGAFTYALKAGVEIRPNARTFTQYGFAYGDEFQYGAAAGVRVADKKLVIGPEIWGASVFYPTGSFFKYGSTPLEALLGLHYTIGSDWRIGGGAGPGITYDLGSPRWRAIALLRVGACVQAAGQGPRPRRHRRRRGRLPRHSRRRAPTIRRPTAAPRAKVADRDHDGIPDDRGRLPRRARASRPTTRRPTAARPTATTTASPTRGRLPRRARRQDRRPEDQRLPVRSATATASSTPRTPAPTSPASRPTTRRPTAARPIRIATRTASRTRRTPAPTSRACPIPIRRRTAARRLRVVGTQIIIARSGEVRHRQRHHPPGERRDPQGRARDPARRTRRSRRCASKATPTTSATRRYNKTLSAQRAASVVTWLASHGVDKSRLSSEGFGMEKPIDTNDTPAGRQNNRRVEFHIEND